MSLPFSYFPFLLKAQQAFTPLTMPSLTFDVKQQNKLAKKMVKLYSIAIISYTLSTYFIFILSVKSIECKEKQRRWKNI